MLHVPVAVLVTYAAYLGLLRLYVVVSRYLAPRVRRYSRTSSIGAASARARAARAAGELLVLLVVVVLVVVAAVAALLLLLLLLLLVVVVVVLLLLLWRDRCVSHIGWVEAASR